MGLPLPRAVRFGESFEPDPGTSHGIKDVAITANMSAETFRRVTCTFDGQFYRAK